MRVGSVTFGQIATFLILLSLGLPIPSQAATFWDDGFENHLTPNWDTGSCGGSPQDGCNPVISTDVAHSGTHSLKGNYLCPGAENGITPCGAFYDRQHTPTNEIWTRFYSYTVNFVNSPVETKRFFHKSGNSPSNVLVDHWWGSRSGGLSTERQVITSLAPCNAGDDACIYYSNVASKPLNDGQWYCIESHVKNNTAGQANGTIEMWVDGTQTVGYYNRELFGGPNPIPQYSALRIYVQSGYGLMYYDDFAVGDTRIGCGVGQSPAQGADITPPSAPAGLTVR